MNFDIFIAGDFYVGTHAGGRLLPLLEDNDIDLLFGDLLPAMKNSVLSIINLEAPLLEDSFLEPKTGPSLKMPTNVAGMLGEAGVDLACIANNHIMDHGSIGLESTLRVLKENKIASVGAGLTENEKRKPYIRTIHNRKIGIINICENEWITDNNSEAGANGLDEMEAYYQILHLKSLTDFIIVIFHGGNEYYSLPSPRIKKTMRFFIDLGADAIIGHHTHTYSGHEIYNGKPIFFSLGNFIFDSRKKSKGKNWNLGIAVGINIVSDKLLFEIIPFEQHAENLGVKILKNENLRLFTNDVERLNVIIGDDYLLQTTYEEFANQLSTQYHSFINPYNGKLSTLFKKGLLPNIYSKYKTRLLLNLVRCESHRDILEIVLKRKFN